MDCGRNPDRSTAEDIECCEKRMLPSFMPFWKPLDLYASPAQEVITAAMLAVVERPFAGSAADNVQNVIQLRKRLQTRYLDGPC
jgi:hypothetical protein